MLFQARQASATVSGRSEQWRNVYGKPQPREVVRHASVWLLDYPGSVIPRPGRTVIATWADPALWKVLEELHIDLLHTGPIQRATTSVTVTVASPPVFSDPVLEDAQPLLPGQTFMVSTTITMNQYWGAAMAPGSSEPLADWVADAVPAVESSTAGSSVSAPAAGPPRSRHAARPVLTDLTAFGRDGRRAPCRARCPDHQPDRRPDRPPCRPPGCHRGRGSRRP